MDQQIYVADMPVSGIHAEKKRKSAFQEFWQRFRKNKLAVAGLAVVVLYILVAIFADLFFSYDFITQNQISNAFAKPLTSAEDDGDTTVQHLYILAPTISQGHLGRIIHGARVSMVKGFTTIAFACLWLGARAIAGIMAAIESSS
jgi:ABC-type antimicrobial peptide transport system permease subunit